MDSGFNRDEEMESLVKLWVAENPSDAANFAYQLPTGEVREAFLRRVLTAWGVNDARAALSWSDQLSVDADFRRARSMICISYAENSGSHVQAIELAAQHGAAEGGDGLIENLTTQWASHDAAASLTWVKSQPAGDLHDRLIARVAFALAGSDPFNAACYVAEEMQAGPIQNEAVISVLHQWAKTDIVGASDWAGNLQDDVLRERATNELAGLRNSGKDE